MITCKDCNMIVNNIIDTPEWRNYKDSSNNPTRCGMPTNSLLPESSLGTNISSRGNNNETMNKVNMYQRWNSMPYKERSLYKVYKDIESKCIDNDLPLIIGNTAKSFYKIISETKISRGSNRIGIIAACIYAIPPVIRLTNLGIREVDKETIEPSEAFGATKLQKLKTVQIPLALPTVFAGVNQTIMMALAMVVIASMIGVKGLGVPILRAISNQYLALGLFNGLAIVALAIIFDRITQEYGRRIQKHRGVKR